MDCYAWKIPEGCYASAMGGRCPSARWFWFLAAAAAGLLLLRGGKRKSATTPRKVGARRKR